MYCVNFFVRTHQSPYLIPPQILQRQQSYLPIWTVYIIRRVTNTN